MPKRETALVQSVEARILILRKQKVILDEDLAELYEVPVKRLNQQIRRNTGRFPADFMFQLTQDEYETLRSQNATSKPGSGGRRYLPYAFTEHGTIMAATVLNSQRAIEMSVFVVRAFVRLRKLFATNRELAEKVTEQDRRLKTHDGTIRQIIDAIKELTSPPATPRKRIGFWVTATTEK